MNFRNDSGELDLRDRGEVWAESAGKPLVGCFVNSGDKYFYHAYDQLDSGTVLYLFSYVDEYVIKDIRDGRIELAEAFTDSSALVFKEVLGNNEKIFVQEVMTRELSDTELPAPNSFVMYVG